MFLCVSPNPAVDKRLRLDSLVPGRIHRIHKAEAHAGGKAAHVAMVLKALGHDVSWLGLIGGGGGENGLSRMQRMGLCARRARGARKTPPELHRREDRDRGTGFLVP